MKLNDVVNMKTATLGWVVGSVTYILSWLATILGIGSKTLNLGKYVGVTGSLVDVNVRAQLESSGVANKLGLSVLQLLRFVPKLEWGQYLTIVIGSIVLVVLGKWIYLGLKWTPRGTPKSKLYLQLLYGAIAVTAIVSIIGGMYSIPAFVGLVLAMAIYYGLVALVLWVIVKLNFLALGKFINN